MTAIPALAKGTLLEPDALKTVGFDEKDLFSIKVTTKVFEPEIPLGAIAFLHRNLEPRDEGDLVLANICWNVAPNTRMLMSYERRRGHDYKGHFCQPGQPEEVIAAVGQ